MDKRTGVFSLGNVLYEMLTGRQAFAGETVSEILARVIEGEPDRSRLPKNTTAEIQHLLRRSLQKDRNRRLQTARMRGSRSRSRAQNWGHRIGPMPSFDRRGASGSRGS